jgi:hypothetical protein
MNQHGHQHGHQHGFCRACGAPLGQVNGRLVCPNRACPTNLPREDVRWSALVAIFLDQLQHAAALLNGISNGIAQRQASSHQDNQAKEGQ